MKTWLSQWSQKQKKGKTGATGNLSGILAGQWSRGGVIEVGTLFVSTILKKVWLGGKRATTGGVKDGTQKDMIFTGMIKPKVGEKQGSRSSLVGSVSGRKCRPEWGERETKCSKERRKTYLAGSDIGQVRRKTSKTLPGEEK